MKASFKPTFQIVIDRFIEKLEQGVCPWKSPYLSSIGRPINPLTGKCYRGINVFLLALQGFSTPYFLTFKQAQEMGGTVKKGESGSFVVKYGQHQKENAEGESTHYSYLKTYHVFNSTQCEGIDFPVIESRQTINPNQAAQRLIDAMPNRPTLEYGSTTAFYRPATDSVHMPRQEHFVCDSAYYQTFFHELCHSTGHASRLARKSLMENPGIHRAGEIYVEEELVAEMGAAFIATETGIIPTDLENSTAYIASWLRTLKDPDNAKWLIRAASQAQKAADFILEGFHNMSAPTQEDVPQPSSEPSTLLLPNTMLLQPDLF